MSESFTFNHLAFRCRNIKEQEKFYTKHFGFKRSRTFRRGAAEEFFMLKLGAMRLELFPPDPKIESEREKGGEQMVGFRHLAFNVPKLETVITGLREEGIEPDKIIELPEIAPGFRIVFFRDPEGNILELMEGYCDEE
jgi:glyoxylase I family protein